MSASAPRDDPGLGDSNRWLRVASQTAVWGLLSLIALMLLGQPVALATSDTIVFTAFRILVSVTLLSLLVGIVLVIAHPFRFGR